MVSALDRLTAKLGEKKSLQQAETVTASSLQQLREYGEKALRDARHSSRICLLEYSSVLKLVEYLRHRNPDCAQTVNAYLGILNSTLKLLSNTSPDELVRAAKESDEDQLEALFLDIDDHWIAEFNGTASRRTKWACLKTFLVSNNVRKATMMKCKIRNRRKTIDYALNKEDCRKVLDAAKTTSDKLTVSLLLESMQRIGTISLLTWGNVKPHLDKGEDCFLIWIDPQRTKCNIEHWAPIGPLSAYYMRKRLTELREEGVEVGGEDNLITNRKHHSMNVAAIAQQFHRIMTIADVVGRKQGQGSMTRYEKHLHSFRKFGKVEMQKHDVNEDVINYLMGHKRDTYSEWGDRYEDLLNIYRASRPTLDEKDAVTDIIDYANSRGYSIDPKVIYNTADLKLAMAWDIKAGISPNSSGTRGAEAPKLLSGDKITRKMNVSHTEMSRDKSLNPLFFPLNSALCHGIIWGDAT